MIKPIETVYKGYRFRSRLEARWAVFFDALGIPWEYEREGFDVNGRWYLPDFWLPTVGLRSKPPGIWVEIKHKEIKDDSDYYKHSPQEEELDKLLHEFVRLSKQSLVLLRGQPDTGKEDNYQYMFQEDEKEHEVWWDNYMQFMKCDICGYIKVEYMESYYCYCPKCSNNSSDDHPDIWDAILASKQARFEHGEKG